MNIAKSASALSLALAFSLMGGIVMSAPASSKAGGFISFDALRRGNSIPQGHNSPNTRPGAQANHHTRGCSAITRCRG